MPVGRDVDPEGRTVLLLPLRVVVVVVVAVPEGRVVVTLPAGRDVDVEPLSDAFV